MKTWIVLGVVLLSLGIVGTGLYLARQEPVLNEPAVLSDGTTITYLGVTVGTNHVFGSKWKRYLSQLPGPLAVFGEKMLKTQPGTTTTRTSATNLVLWFEQESVNGGSGRSGYRHLRLRSKDGRQSGGREYLWLTLAPGQSNRLHSVAFGNWPRREAWFDCVLLEDSDASGGGVPIAVFDVKNPLRVDTPSWTPEPLLTTRSAGDLKVTLLDFASGIGRLVDSRYRDNGIREDIFHMATGQEEPQALIRVKLESSRGPEESWRLFDLDLSDSSGNSKKAESRSMMASHNLFSPVLWSDESAWKMRLHLKRDRGFRPDEMLTFSNVALPAVTMTNAPSITNVVMGVTSRLARIIRRKPQTDNRGWNPRSESAVRLEHDDTGETNQIDLIRITAQPMNEVLELGGSSRADRHHEFFFQSIPTNATHLDFVFSVQRARFVEFMVSPNWITNEYVVEVDQNQDR